MPDRKSRPFIYKIARFDVPHKTLQTTLATALSRCPQISLRTLILARVSGRSCFINEHVTHGNMLCGTFCAYVPGGRQEVIETSFVNDNVSLTTVGAPTQIKGKPANTEFAKGVSFYGIFGNHVVFSPSASLRVGAFEEYLNWLLQIQTKTVPSGVTLDDQLPPDSRKKINHAKGIRMTAPIRFSLDPRKAKQMQDGVSLVPQGPGWNVLMGLFKDSPLLPEIFSAARQIESSQIIASVNVRWNKRLPAGDHTPFIDEIVEATRHIDDDLEYEIDLGRGSKLSSKDVKLRESYTFEYYDGLPSPIDVYEAMKNWLDNLFALNRIESE